MFVDPIQPHEKFTMCVKCLFLKCRCKIITFHISCWLVDNSADFTGFESISYIKILYINMFFFCCLISIRSLPVELHLFLSCSIVTSDPRGFNGEFMSIDLTCDSKKCLIHMTKVIVSSTPTSSVSVEFLVLIFCFVDIDNTRPYPKVRQALV